jgi:DnaJ-class molecular chaperone
MNLLSLLSSQFIMELTFTQAAKGVNKEMAFNTEASCQRCDGKGSEPGTKVVHCHYCNGSGMVGDMMCGVKCSCLTCLSHVLVSRACLTCLSHVLVSRACLTCLSHVLVCFALYRRR